MYSGGMETTHEPLTPGETTEAGKAGKKARKIWDLRRSMAVTHTFKVGQETKTIAVLDNETTTNTETGWFIPTEAWCAVGTCSIPLTPIRWGQKLDPTELSDHQDAVIVAAFLDGFWADEISSGHFVNLGDE